MHCDGGIAWRGSSRATPGLRSSGFMIRSGGGRSAGCATGAGFTGRDTGGAEIVGGLEMCIGTMGAGALPIPAAAMTAIRNMAAS